MLAPMTIPMSSERQVAPSRPSLSRRPRWRSLAEAFKLIGAPVRFERNTEIYGEEEPAEYFYQVVSGAVRTYKLLEDGRRQIGAFHLPGDVFGLEAGGTTASAPRRSPIPRSGLPSGAPSSPWPRVTTTSPPSCGRGRPTDLARAQDHMLLLGRKNAEERVASFLLEMAGRAAGASTIELPMSRQDIADYLGLTIETVSRTLTQLESKAAIELPSSRRVTLCNRAALQRLNA